MGRVAKFKKVKKTVSAVDSDGIWGFGDNGVKPKKRSRTAEKLRQQKMNRKLKRIKDNPRAAAKYHQQQQQQQQHQHRAGGRSGSSFGGSGSYFNCPPSDNEDEFDLEDIQGTVKKQKHNTSTLLYNDDDDDNNNISATTVVKSTTTNNATTNKSSTVTSTTMETIDRKEIKEATQLLKNDSTVVFDHRGTSTGTTNTTSAHQATATGATKTYEGRRENESKKAYNRRVKDETINIIKQTQMKELNSEKRQRKKEFLNQKKKRKRGGGRSGGGGGGVGNDDDDDDDNDVRRRRQQQQQHHNNYDDEVPFGYQVERPPELSAFSKQKKKKNVGPSSSSSNLRNNLNVKAEQENLEKMRQKVQEQYAIIKAKRKRAGDFHL